MRWVHGTLFEVTPAGKTVWKYVNPTTGSGPLRQGEPVPTEQLRSGREVPANQVYRAYRYAPDYPGLQGLDLTPGEPIELYDTPLARILHEGGFFGCLDVIGHFAAHIRDGDWPEMASEGASERWRQSRESVFEPWRCPRA